MEDQRTEDGSKMLKDIETISQLEQLAEQAWSEHMHNKEDLIRLTQLVTKAQTMLLHSREVFDHAQLIASHAVETYEQMYSISIIKKRL